MFLGTWLLRYWHWSELVTWSSCSKNYLCLTLPLCTFSYVQSSKFLAINYWKVGFKPIKVQCFPGCCCIDYWRWTEDGLVVAFFICFFFAFLWTKTSSQATKIRKKMSQATVYTVVILHLHFLMMLVNNCLHDAQMHACAHVTDQRFL